MFTTDSKTYTTVEANDLIKRSLTAWRSVGTACKVVTEPLGSYMTKKSVVANTGRVLFSMIGSTVPGRGRGRKLWHNEADRKAEVA